jgi:hypothetical protein
MTHLGILDADAPIFGHPFAQRGCPSLSAFDILLFHLRGCRQTLLDRRFLIAFRLRLQPAFHDSERG